MIRTGEQYLESLRDGRRVFYNGGFIDDLTTHPATRGYAHSVAEYYDLHHDPALVDTLTFVDSTDGVRRSRAWKLPRSKEDLVERRKFHEFWFRHFFGVFGRLPHSQNLSMFTMIDDPQPWEDTSVGSDGHALAQVAVNMWQHIKENDLSCCPMFIDAQFDRARPESMGLQPQVRVIETSAAGVRVEGWKPVVTNSVYSDEIHLGVLYRPGTEASQILYGLLPTNWPGLTHVLRPSNARPDDDPGDYPHAATLGDELDGMTYFDNVLIPWDRIFHIANPEHAKHYPQRVFDWVHTETQIRETVNAEMIAGLAILVTETLGTGSAPIVASMITDMIRFRETCRAFTLASESEPIITPGGLYKTHNLFMDFGRAYYLENVAKMVDALIEMCGRGIVIQPHWKDFAHPEWGPRIAGALKGPDMSAEDRTRIFKFIHERFLTAYGSRHELFERFNGTPLFVLRLLTRNRLDYSIDGPLTELARKAVGLGALTEMGDVRRAGAAAHSPYPTFEQRTDYVEAQDSLSLDEGRPTPLYIAKLGAAAELAAAGASIGGTNGGSADSALAQSV
jgi:aromatic ring hydroxylase